ncbi:NUDIX domain-containing protein [Aureibacter tunicatorum]|uniref:NUDIX family NTP pyrophosphohydrolase n=1 Tax=Aureibacter tunicatorum TaxID=866807 RepID=A0AAE3XR26_9BACT|nr:NUDIX domain-containing protein [Aureibacter tunicatorum]MDR6240488.1 putative NUDIX family NTP pyrophosphohydrolase [Aureibacter tunicatorum]BDD06649.1 NTP pyrophosphohydrolase [Aureibacter tunicatorum]
MTLSAGILVYRLKDQMEVMLLKPGGPFYKNQDIGVWTIPKGEIHNNESPYEAAIREFQEETGFVTDQKPSHFIDIKLRKGKSLSVFVLQESFDISKIKSNSFAMEYPKGSGKTENFPEIEKGKWVSLDEALIHIHSKQKTIIERFVDAIDK